MSLLESHLLSKAFPDHSVESGASLLPSPTHCLSGACCHCVLRSYSLHGTYHPMMYSVTQFLLSFVYYLSFSLKHTLKESRNA